MFRYILLAILFLSGCGTFDTKNSKMSIPEAISFDYESEHFVSLPVKINGSNEKKFIFDTGIGINLISKKICEHHKCKPIGRFIGKRMSGQEISVDLVEIESASLGSYEVKNFVAGIFDVEKLMPNQNIGGFLSVGFFGDRAISIDYNKKSLTFENNESLKKIKSSGVSTPIKIHKDGPSTGITMDFILPNKRAVSVELDTGSQALVLHENFMSSLGLSPTDPRIKVRKGIDETGNKYIRYYSNLNGLTHIPESSDIGVQKLNVMFQKIIYDGLMGQFFLKPFVVTYNFKQSEMIFRK